MSWRISLAIHFISSAVALQHKEGETPDRRGSTQEFTMWIELSSAESPESTRAEPQAHTGTRRTHCWELLVQNAFEQLGLLLCGTGPASIPICF